MLFQKRLSRVRHARPLCLHRDVCSYEPVTIARNASRSAAPRKPQDMVCTFCGTETEYLAKGPEACICEGCLTRTITGVQVPEEAHCSFCGKRERGSRFSFLTRDIVLTSPGGDARICSQCISAAHEVITEMRRRSSET